MRLGYFALPVHPAHRSWAETPKEDRQTVILADKPEFHDSFIGEHLSDRCETITNSMRSWPRLSVTQRPSSLRLAPRVFRKCTPC